MQSVSPMLSKLGADVVARMAHEVVTGGACAVRLQLLASQFYEAVRAELDKTPRHEGAKAGALTAAADQCRRSAGNSLSPHLMLIEMRAAVAMLNDGARPPPSDVVVRFRPPLRVIQGGRA
jgi:hypothetical protein